MSVKTAIADIRRVYLCMDGRVQGVGYRAAMARKANVLGITGWVRNRGDGKVEAVAEARHADVERLLRWAGKGPLLARVRDVHVEELPGTCAEFEGFEVRY